MDFTADFSVMSQGDAEPQPAVRSSKLKIENVDCDLGEVAGLSSTSMRIACKGKSLLQMGQLVRFRIIAGKETIVADGKAVSYRRAGFRKRIIQVDFINMTRALSQKLHGLRRKNSSDSYSSEEYRSADGKTDVSLTAESKQGMSPAERLRRRQHILFATMVIPNPYLLLGVSPKASEQEITSAYEELARKFNPDIDFIEDSEVKLADVKRAYELLIDAKRRELFNMNLAA